MSEEESQEYGRGEHPRSRENLRPRRETYGETKKIRKLTITETGWQGLKEIASELEVSSISDLLEKIGRKELSIAVR